MTSVKQLPPKLKAAIEELKSAHGKISENLLDSQDASWPTDEVVNQVTQELAKPDWHVSTQNSITSTNPDSVVDIRFTADFSLNIGKLARVSHDVTSDSHDKTFAQYTQVLDPQVKELVLNSIAPQSFGIAENLSIESWYSYQEDPQPNLDNKRGIIRLLLKSSQVHLDYANLINAILPLGMHTTIASQQENMSVPLAIFQANKSFSQTFSWQEADSVFRVTADFNPVA